MADIDDVIEYLCAVADLKHDRKVALKVLAHIQSTDDHHMSYSLADLHHVFHERYRIERELGAGGKAVVYLARATRRPSWR